MQTSINKLVVNILKYLFFPLKLPLFLLNIKIHLETNYKAVYELTWDCLEYIECAVVKDLASRYPWALGKRWVFESSPGPSLPFQHASYLATCFPRAPWLVEPIQRRLMGSKTSLSALEPGTKTGSVSSRTNVSTVT